jgi:hypothetical protein
VKVGKNQEFENGPEGFLGSDGRFGGLFMRTYMAVPIIPRNKPATDIP